MSTLQTTNLKHPDASGNQITFTSGGLVGVGTSSPGYPLTIACNGNAQGISLEGRSADDIGEFTFFENDGTTQLGRLQGRQSYFQISATDNTKGIFIDNSNNVGIGFTTPSAPFHISDPNHGIAAGYVGGTLPNSAGIYTSSSTSHGQAYGSLIVQARADFSGYGISFRASNQERMRIDGSGRLLFVKSSSGLGIDGLELQNTGSGAALTITNSGNGVNNVVLNSRYGAGSQYPISFRFSATEVGYIEVTSSQTFYRTSSDYRLKENVVQITDGINRIKQLKPSRFNFIVDPSTTVDGFLAHEAQAVVPEAVNGEKDGEKMQGIDQSKLVPVLTAALQEAIAKIESLEQRLSDAGIA